jgi:hypothetical protein
MSPVADDAPPAERHDPPPGVIDEMNEVTPLPSPRGKADCKGSRRGSGEGMREKANAGR